MYVSTLPLISGFSQEHQGWAKSWEPARGGAIVMTTVDENKLMAFVGQVIGD